MLLEGKTAVVTGGTRGIGRQIAMMFADNGADLAIVATSNSQSAKETVEELEGKGRKARLYLCDIKNNEQVSATVEEIMADFGRVDILVNNAGITRDNILPCLSPMDIDDVIDVNLKGAIFVTRALIRNFVKQRSGNVINISSIVGLMGNKGQSNYAAAKAGLIGFTKTVAREYGRKNIRCNAIAPGFIDTEMTARMDEKAIEDVKGQLLLGRLGKPEDVAQTALFLASDLSSYITGEVIKVDGGMYV